MAEEKKSQKGGHRKHYCPTCGEEAKAVLLWPKKKMVYRCAQEHESRRNQCVLK